MANPSTTINFLSSTAHFPRPESSDLRQFPTTHYWCHNSYESSRQTIRKSSEPALISTQSSYMPGVCPKIYDPHPLHRPWTFLTTRKRALIRTVITAFDCDDGAKKSIFEDFYSKSKKGLAVFWSLTKSNELSVTVQFSSVKFLYTVNQNKSNLGLF